ncbi:hypothetical protein AMJ44_15640 [candidate division WOR-1 bacterium DG_54_3]|uniref:Uncharacterized protein n=1 Tax=candidate division WOR-1 bacterium DG_54_3 TaxID=1703775 RepID=A0A0S7XIV7_UNCSA|nr:MAG: hypothetical protein AMJ44_15640 [candidate division WOR-1 bacterium DG_54_3]
MKIQSITNNQLPITNNQLPITNYHGAHGTISTTVESALQIHLFMQNKAANMKKWTLGQVGKTKPIQTQFKANTKPIQTQFKPNTNPNKPNPPSTLL